jgi:hypothetical protein
MGAEVFGAGVRGMASGPQEFNIDSDGWCLYKAYLNVFTPYRDLPVEERTAKAIALASRLAAIATDEDKAYIERRLTDVNYDGQDIFDASGSRTGRFGYPSQIPAGPGEEYVNVGAARRKIITTADEYLQAMRTPYGSQPQAWGSISLLRPLFIRFRPDIYFDVRVHDATGEADANTGRVLLGQDELKYLGPNGERNLSFLMEGPHYNVRIYSFIDEDPLPADEDELIAAALGSLLLGSAATAIDQSGPSRNGLSGVRRLAEGIQRAKELKEARRMQMLPSISEGDESQNGNAVSPSSVSVSQTTPRNRGLPNVGGIELPIWGQGAAPAQPPAPQPTMSRTRALPNVGGIELQPRRARPSAQELSAQPQAAAPPAMPRLRGQPNVGGIELQPRRARPSTQELPAQPSLAQPLQAARPYIPRAPVPAEGAAERLQQLERSGAEPSRYNRRLNTARERSVRDQQRTHPLSAVQPGVVERAIRGVGSAIASTVPEPGGVEYVPQPVPPVPSVSGLFPRIAIPSFDSTAIPQPRHRRRHAYRRFVAPPPAPISAPVGAPTRSTEIPAWANQHITDANVAANVKGVAAAVKDDVLAMQDYRGVDADPAYASYKADPKTRGLDTSGGDPVHWEEIKKRYPDRNVLIRDASDTIHRFLITNPYRATSYRRKPTFTFGDPAGLNPQQSMMAQQNLDVLMEIAPEEMIADTKFATALLESLWYCGAGHDIGGDPRCFPARVLGELREYKMFKDEKARASFAARARQYSEWNFIKGVLKKVRGQLKGTDVGGPVRVSGVPSNIPSVGQNLSVAAASSVGAIAARSAAAGVEAPVEVPVAPAAAAENKNVGPIARRRLRPLVRIPVAPPPSQLGAIGIIPQPPPNTLGAWGSRFRPIIPT